MGGFDGSVGLSTIEAYDPKIGEWRMLASMSTRRSSVGVGVLKGLRKFIKRFKQTYFQGSMIDNQNNFVFK